MPHVSLILCTKNGMPYLPEAVGSTCAQTYRDFEVIVQDACSTDGSIEYLRTVQGLPSIAIVSEPDSGIGDAYNRAVRRCRGEIIGSIDADNLLEPDALAKVIQQFTDHPQAAALYGASHNITADGDRSSTWVPPDFYLSGLLACDVVPPFGQSFFSRAVCGTELRFDESMATCADYDLWLRLSNHPIVRIEEVIGSVRRSAKSMTCQPQRYDEFCRDKLAALKRFLIRSNEPVDGASYRRAAGGIYAWAAQSVSKLEGENKRAEKYLQLAEQLAPELPLVQALVAEVKSRHSGATAFANPTAEQPTVPLPPTSASSEKSIPPGPQSDSPDEFIQLRARLGRMVRQTTPLTTADFLAAQLALNQILDQPDLLDFIRVNSAGLPPATIPLLLHHLGEAWTCGDHLLAESLELIYGRITRAPASAAMPHSTPRNGANCLPPAPRKFPLRNEISSLNFNHILRALAPVVVDDGVAETQPHVP